MHVLFDSLQLLNFGGPLIWPLLLLAVLMVAILLDKSYI
jgi:biopolymer transport protein ExbB